MEEQNGWKTHSFTLMVFAGIVFLCSIFFVLGMLVGRAQAQKLSAEVAEEAPVVETAEADTPELTFYETVDEDEEPPTLDPAPVKAPAPRPEPARVAKPQPGPVVNLQIAALRRSVDAERLLAEIKKKGFKGFILAPPRGERNPLYRVQVGPFSDPIQAESERQKLASAGYNAIKR